jgi:hypothetical protein
MKTIEIKTKYKVGDKVWTVFRGEVEEQLVAEIQAIINKEGAHISYVLNKDGGSWGGTYYADSDKENMFSSKKHAEKEAGK